jgi:hypothetical protein
VLGQSADSRAAKSGAVKSQSELEAAHSAVANAAPADPDLACIIAAWPTVLPPVRSRILSMVLATDGS